MSVGSSASPGNHFVASIDIGDDDGGVNSNLSSDAPNSAHSTPARNQNSDPQPHVQSQWATHDQQTTPTTTPVATSARDAVLLQQFWRTYDTVLILSIFAVVGIVFRMMSATWFRMELGSVFSEDSALGTNLPLNMLSCFLMGLLCSGRDAMGIVHSKVLSGTNIYGRGILDVGKGVYRYVALLTADVM
eukprot:CAMPEP_0181096206 /NCGR_PEP_ID=MMETSP1071-20121207/10910_1 /TAXON_ID=35127 /ORGANISM="Thalassiosira sp., Strain NH16" /LENGTH=188 /DNA_ID=CAMNT_0023178601 /DNA_START=201 /DNA_END=767 /DNA_ORIENTATION=+